MNHIKFALIWIIKLPNSIWFHLRNEHFPLIKRGSDEVQNYSESTDLVCMEEIDMTKITVFSDSNLNSINRNL